MPKYTLIQIGFEKVSVLAPELVEFHFLKYEYSNSVLIIVSIIKNTKMRISGD